MAQYLPVLLVSVSAISAPTITPDDSVLDTQAINQVDYLSHHWQEEDIAKSWRNMTRRKDYIQNGARLENASWRTWWKQRNNLPTVTPETLNWLKDSDVTWLYGPLHTAADWAQLSRQLAAPDNSIQTSLLSTETAPSSSLRNSRSGASRSNSPWALKSILKHRSISELLAVPFPSPHSEQMELEEDPYFRRSSSSGTIHGYIAKSEPTNIIRKRPKLTHARSDTNVHRHNPFRGDSPPLPLIPEDPLSLPPPVEHPDSSGSDSNNSSQPPAKKRITFNTFVEQRIAIEKPNMLRDPYYTDADVVVDGDEAFGDEGYDQDDEISNEDDSDDDILQMKSSAYLCPGKSRRRLSSASSSTASYGTVYDTSAEREHVTIAPIAPTILKTSAVSSPISATRGIWEEDVEIEDVECLFAGMTPPSSSILELEQADDDVNLVFAPPQGSVYAERLAMNGNVPSILNGKEATAAFVRVLGTSPTTQLSKPLHPPSFYDDDDDDDEILYDPQSKTRVPSPSFGAQFVRVSPPSVQDNMNGSSSLTLAAVLKNTPSDVRTSEADVLSTGSKGSGSASEEGTVVAPQTLPTSTSTQATSTNIRASPTKRIIEDHDSPSPVRSYVKTSRAQFHIHQVPSPARSTTSTGTSTTTTSNGSTSGVSNGSPLLEPPSRGRSISPVTSASPSRDDSRGRSGSIGKANGSSMPLADDRDEPARGRSRSRSIGSSPLEGSVSPRSGSRSRLVNGRGSLDNLGSYSCGPPRLGSFNSPVWREASLSPEELDGRREGRSTRPRRTGSGLVERERSTSGRDESSLSPPSHPSPSGSYVKDRVSRAATKTVSGVTSSETPNVSNSPSLVSSARTSLPAVPENPAPSSLASFPTPPTPEILLVPVAKSKPIDIPAPSLSSSQGLSANKNVLTAPAHLPTPLPDLARPVTTPAIMGAISTLPAVLPSLIPVPPPPSINTPTASTPVSSSSSSTPTTPRASNFEESAISRAMTSARGYLGSLWNSNTAGVVVVNERQTQAQVQHAR